MENELRYLFKRQRIMLEYRLDRGFGIIEFDVTSQIIIERSTA